MHPRSVLRLLCVASVLSAMSCGDPESTQPPEPDPTDPDPPIEVIGLTLEDEFGAVATEFAGTVQGEVQLWAGETIRLSLRVHTSEGDLSGLETSDSVSVTTSTWFPAKLEVRVHPERDAIHLSFLGHTGTSDSLRIQILGPDHALYTSAWIPVSVEEPAEVHGMELYSSGVSVYRQLGDTDTGLLALDREATLPVEIAFLDREGGTIPTRSLGENVRVAFDLDSPLILEAVADSVNAYAVQLHPIDIGAVGLRLRLLRNERVVYESRDVAIDVARQWPAWCSTFGPENAPNGRVLDLAVSAGSLIAGGQFTRIGSLDAPGIARWDGHVWHAMGSGLTDVRWVLGEEGRLVAGGNAGGFHDWNGTSWEFLAPTPPNTRNAVLYNGDLIVRADRELLRWTGATWMSMTPAGHEVRTIATHAGSLYFGATYFQGGGYCQSDDYLGSYDGHTWQRAHHLPCGPCDLCYSGVLYLGSAGASLVLEWDHDSPAGHLAHLEFLRGGAWTSLGPELGTRGAAEVEGRLYVVSADFVFELEGTTMQNIAHVLGGEIRDAVEYQDRLYVSGAFTSIEGTPSFYIGCLEP